MKWEPVAAAGNENGGSRERVSDFSLEIHKIQPSAVFEARRKNVLRGAGYAWTPGSGVSSNSLR